MNPDSWRFQAGVLRALVVAAFCFAISGAPSVSQAAADESFSVALAKAEDAQAQGQWLEARAGYGDALRISQDDPDQEIQALLGLARSERALGEVPASVEYLERALKRVSTSGSAGWQAAVEASMGSSQLALGKANSAEEWFKKARQEARIQNDFALVATVENDWGILEALRGDLQAASSHFEASATAAVKAKLPSLEARALINAARSMAQTQPTLSAQFRKRAASQLPSVPESAVQAQLWVNLGEQESNQTPLTPKARVRAAQWLYAGLEVADQLGAEAVAAHALLALSVLYQTEDRNAEALELADRALARGRASGDTGTLYRLEAQRARLLQSAGKTQDAMAAYRRAIEALKPLRHRRPWAGELNSSSFDEATRPLYESLIGLLLDQSSATSDPLAQQDLLRQARDVLEDFKAAELRDYFRDDCVEALQSRLANIESVSSSAAVVYPVSLPDRLVVLTTWPSGEIVQHEKAINQSDLAQEASALRRRVEQAGTRRYLPHAQKLYDWLIRPIAPELEKKEVKTLVFVPSGALLTVPMAVLHDGQGFLVDRYALGLTPGLELTDPRPFKQQDPEALLAGLSEGVDGFAALPNVVGEIDQVHSILGGEVLLNGDFRRDTLREQLAEQAYSVVHLATHAVFSSTDDGAYLLTFDGPLSMQGLAVDIGTFRFRKQPLELLTLSACETAQGSERAALGLSGVAVQAGARSALGSLWSVNDPATARLVGTFYQGLLEPGVSRAQALARAQRDLKKDFRYRHPAYWAAFQMIGSWL